MTAWLHHYTSSASASNNCKIDSVVALEKYILDCCMHGSSLEHDRINYDRGKGLGRDTN